MKLNWASRGGVWQQRPSSLAWTLQLVTRKKNMVGWQIDELGS